MPRTPPAVRPRLLRMGLATLLGVARRGWFIPCRHAAAAADARTYPELEPLFAAAGEEFARLLGAIDRLGPELQAIDGPPPQPRWDQGWFPRLDAAAAYAMVRERRPARIVEVGAGHSTRFLARAAADGGLAVRHAAIDPAPRAGVAALAVEHLPVAVQEAGLGPFRALRGGDVLFVDSSHVLMPGSDADFLLNRVWPILPPGALVHFHDVLLPDGYPEAWAWRGYNEQLGIAALLSGGAARLLFSSRYVVTRMAPALAACAASRLPMMEGAVETGLWIEKI